MSDTLTGGAKEAVVNGVMERLFAVPELKTYAVLDGAAIPDLLPKLEEEAPEYACLYRGELEPDLAECAPYLVQLTKESAFTKWVVSEGWGNNWGIFALTGVDLPALRRHFRGFLLVMSPEGKRLYFRYYDPRVLREYLPTCNAQEAALVFGPVARYWCEDARTDSIAMFEANEGLARKTLAPLGQRVGANALA